MSQTLAYFWVWSVQYNVLYKTLVDRVHSEPANTYYVDPDRIRALYSPSPHGIPAGCVCINFTFERDESYLSVYVPLKMMIRSP